MDEAYYKMDITLDEYIKYLALTKGFIYWQFLFCKNLSKDLKDDISQNYAKRMLNDLPRLFPSENYDELEKVVKEFNKKAT
jgi:hypothetical protein